MSKLLEVNGQKYFWKTAVTVADQRVTNNNFIQRIASPITIIKYLQTKNIE